MTSDCFRNFDALNDFFPAHSQNSFANGRESGCQMRVFRNPLEVKLECPPYLKHVTSEDDNGNRRFHWTAMGLLRRPAHH